MAVAARPGLVLLAVEPVLYKRAALLAHRFVGVAARNDERPDAQSRAVSGAD